jgi:MFS family permease
MTAAALPLESDARARRNVRVLVAAQAILGAQMPVQFVLGGLAGQMLTPVACLATLPVSLTVFGSMASAPILAALMQKYGRRPGFVIGAAGGGLGAALCAWGLLSGSFVLFLAGSALTGLYMSAQGFYRFAATDGASAGYRPKAISYVMAAGLVSAILGPQMVKITADWFAPIPFAGAYAAVVVLNLIGVVVFAWLDSPRPKPPAPDGPQARTRRELLRNPTIAVAMICGMVSYALMNLVMTSTPLAVVGCGFATAQAADVVMGHVLAMFAPSFVTGHLIARFGAERVIAAGLVTLAAAGRGRAPRRHPAALHDRADPARHRLELRLHRRDRHAHRRPHARGARPRPGHERRRGLRPRRHRLPRLGRADELHRLGPGPGLDRRQPRDDPLPHARRRRADLAHPQPRPPGHARVRVTRALDDRLDWGGSCTRGSDTNSGPSVHYRP